MRKIVVFALLLIISATSFSQQTTASPTLTKQDYLQKSKKQKTAAWVCLGGGAGLVLIGRAVAPKDYNVWYDVNTPEEDRQYHFFEALASTGLISMLVSIPLFIAARRNKKKGMSLSFKNETTSQLSKQNFVYRPVPSLSLKISF